MGIPIASAMRDKTVRWPMVGKMVEQLGGGDWGRLAEIVEGHGETNGPSAATRPSPQWNAKSGRLAVAARTGHGAKPDSWL